MGARKLTDAEKAAVVILAVGEEAGGRIMADMPAPEARRVALALSRLGRVDQATVDEVMREFNDRLKGDAKRGGRLEGNSLAARRLLEAAAAKSGHQLALDEVFDAASPALRETLAEFDLKVLGNYLKRELPQTVALVLAHLDAKRAGELLRSLPAATQTDLVVRLARLEAVEPETLNELNEALLDEARRAGRRASQVVGGVDKVAALLNAVDKGHGDALLGRLEESDPELAASVRQQMFTFADLARLDDRGIQELLKAVPGDTLRLALKQAPEGVASRLYANMSARARAMIQDDLAAMPKVKLSEVETAQRQIAELAVKLADAGRLVLRESDEKYV